MTQPTPYSRGYSFTSFQTVNPDDPLPADKLDIEFNRIKITTDEILANLAKIQRDDGLLANNSVDVEQLAATFSAFGLGQPRPWAAPKAYLRNMTVVEANKLYVCEIDHISAVFASDLAAGKWTLVADLTAVITDTQALVAQAQAAAASAEASAQAAIAVQGLPVASSVTGAANAIVLGFSPILPAAPRYFAYVSAGTNTSPAVTVQCATFGTFNVVRNDGFPLDPGDLPGAGKMVLLTISGTNAIVNGLTPPVVRTRASAVVDLTQSFFVSVNGTYSQSGTTVTVTASNHGLKAGHRTKLDFTSGAAVNIPSTQVITATANSFTVTAAAPLTASGNVTVNISNGAIASQQRGIDSVFKNIAGTFFLNLTESAPSQQRIVVVGTGYNSGTDQMLAVTGVAFSSNCVRLRVFSQTGTAVDADNINCLVFW